jgi:hypothetical protein
MSQWFNVWKSGGFVDGWMPENDHEKEMTIDRLQSQLDRLSHIVQRDSAGEQLGHLAHEPRNPLAPTLNQLEIDYKPADHLRIREVGPRHDNDFEDIQKIGIPPTQEEMTSATPPFLPANVPGAAHHLVEGSMEKLLDIQFRLLREELL